MISSAIRKFRRNEMVSSSFYTSIGTMVGFVSGFVVNKVVATLLGPSGVAVVSQFQNFIAMNTSIASGGIQQGVVKYLAEFRENVDEKSTVLSTGLPMTLFFAICTGVVIATFSGWFTLKLFDDSQYQYIVRLLGVTIALFGLNSFAVNILNGLGEIKKLVAVNISTYLFSLFVTAASAYFYGLKGALISLALSQSVIFFVSLYLVSSSDSFRFDLFSGKFDKGYCLKFLEYSLMTVFGAVLIPFLNIGIRNHIVSEISLEAAGYWDGIFRISTTYLGLVTTSLSIYYLPKLSNLADRAGIRMEIINGYKVISPILLIVISLIYLFRVEVILILYSKDFLEMKDLFFPQLLGDFFKIMSWLLSFLMLAKAMTKLFLITQVLFLSLNYFLSIYLITSMGVVGVVWAYALTNFVYMIGIFLLFGNYLKK